MENTCEECEMPIPSEGLCHKCQNEIERQAQCEEEFNQRHSIYD